MQRTRRVRSVGWGMLGCLCLAAPAAVLAPPPGGNPNGGGPPGPPDPPNPTGATPNILFIILDDVGIDQLAIFNPEADDPPQTPNINAIAAAGVKFTNHWTMPECSPSRSCFFTGRYPFRTGVDAALLSDDLPRAQVSPFEVTIPRVLATAGYRSALIGKYHLGETSNNPAGLRMPYSVGWDYFNGTLRSPGPPPDDKTLGGQIPSEPPCGFPASSVYSCGFPTGPGTGACWRLDDHGDAFCDDNGGAGFTGHECVTLGGIPALDASADFAATCADAASVPDFTVENGYYVWPQVINDHAAVTSLTPRRYATTEQTDAGIEWVQGVPPAHPWMCTMSYSADHDPFQQPPLDLYPPGFQWPAGLPELCSGTGEQALQAQRTLSNLMIFAMDKEIGRLLVSLGLAEYGPGGELIYDPEATHTMVIVAGDNGSLYTTVREPYDFLLSKGTAYQTGVLTPLIVAGPLVTDPGRSVDDMVNCVDLFKLFGDIAGVDVRAVVPASHLLDCEPMLGYLTDPDQPAVRALNFTQIGDGIKPTSETTGPCVLLEFDIPTCTDYLLTSQCDCEEQGGTWYGAGAEQEFSDCCDLKADLIPDLQLGDPQAWAIRNARYKLIKFDRPSCEATEGEFEFFDLQSNPYGLDNDDLLTDGEPVGLTDEQLANFEALRAAIADLLATEILCYGDGNLDKRVDMQDFTGAIRNLGQASVFDFDNDGTTDEADLECILSNLGNVCTTDDPGAPCP